MTPTLSGRIQTRLLLIAVIGVPWTLIVTPALPKPGWVPLSMLYEIMYKGLATVAIVGIGWEVVYHAVQQLRWDKDWPSILQLLVMVNEATLTWLILHAYHVIPGTVGLDAPLAPAYSIYFASTWIVIWLVTQGPMRVVALRWRFEGARILPRRGHTIEPNLDHQPDAGSRTAGIADRRPRPARPRQDSGGTPVVGGVECGSGHFNHPQTRFCVRCGQLVCRPGPVTVTRPRPVLGALLQDDGGALALDQDYVVGSAARRDPRVRAGHARPLTVRLPRGCRTPVRLHIRLSGWQVLLCDEGSAAGTRILMPGEREWTALPAHHPLPVTPGTRVRVAGAEFVIASHWPLSGQT